MRNAFRSRYLWALALLLILLGTYSAHANGVSSSIRSGASKTGTVTGTGHDEYTFTVTAGSAFVAVVGETGIHDKSFVPQIERIAPGGASRGGGTPLQARLEEQNAAEGTWTLRVSRADGGKSGGTYALTLVQLPGAAGTAMSTAHDYSGNIANGGIDVYTFTGTAGHKKTLTIKRTGDSGLTPEISVYTPAGMLDGGGGCENSCDQDVSTAAGTYTVLVSRFDDSSASFAYTLSVNDKN
jgi:hypothetical protein